MRNSFKNFNQKDDESKASSPPPKRLRIYTGEEVDITEEEYEDAIKQLQGIQLDLTPFYTILICLEEYKSRKHGKGSKQSTVKQLMDKTKIKRHHWIQTEKPMVSEVTKKFSYLTSSRWVSIFS